MMRSVLLVAGWWSVTVAADTPVAPPPRTVNHGAAQKVAQLVEGYRQGAVRVNGVKLDATVEGKGDDIRVGWAIDYTGPRLPLHILKPSLTDHPAAGETLVLFFLIGADGEAYGVPYPAPAPPPFLGLQSRIDRTCYLTVERGGKGAGTLPTSAGVLWKAAREKWVGKFDAFPPAGLYVQLRFSPNDRGEEHDLDAWTGKLQTELVPVPLTGLVPAPPPLGRP